MKKYIGLLVIALFLVGQSQAQIWKSIKKAADDVLDDDKTSELTEQEVDK